jgi:hypothetical protein
MDLLLAILIGIAALFIYYSLVAMLVAMIPVFTGLGIFLIVCTIAYMVLKSRH